MQLNYRSLLNYMQLNYRSLLNYRLLNYRPQLHIKSQLLRFFPNTAGYFLVMIQFIQGLIVGRKEILQEDINFSHIHSS